MAQAGFRLDDDLAEKIDERLVPGQKKSVWYRYAVQTMIEVEPELDELFDRYEFEERKEFVARAVSNEVDRVKEQNR